MKQLLLFRHALAESRSASGHDFDRVLSEHGRLQAAAQGEWLAGRELRLDRVLSSPARRATETAELAGLAISHRIRLIYEASVGDLVRLIESHVDAAGLCLVGHNPGISGLGGYLTGRRIVMRPGEIVGMVFDPPVETTPQPGSGRLRWLKYPGAPQGTKPPSAH